MAPTVDALASGRREDLRHRPRVLVYAPEILPVFQPWLLDQVTGLTSYDAVLAGRARVSPSIDVSGIATFALGEGLWGKARGAPFLLSGRSRRLESFIRRFSPDIIHAHFGTGGTEISAVAQRLNIPLIVSYHGYDSTIGSNGRPKSRYDRLHLRKREAMFNHARAILSTSDFMRDRVIALGCDASKVVTHYLGVDTDIFCPAPSEALPGSLIFVGRLTKFKGVDAALDVVRTLRTRGLEVHLTMIGDGPERGRLAEQIKSEDLPIDLTGSLPRTEVLNRLRRSMVHMFPSTALYDSRPEFLGVAPLEAQALGVPSVGTRIGGVPEVIENGKTGFLVDDGDWKGMADRVQRLLCDPDLHDTMSVAATKFVKAKFGLKAQIKRLESIYDQVNR